MSDAIDMIKSLFGYNYWANGRILLKAEELAEADYFEDQELGHGNLHNTLFHTLRTEQVWGEIVRTQGAPDPTRLITPNQVPSLGLLKKIWKAEEIKMLRFLDALSEGALDKVVELPNPITGELTPMIPWKMLHHLLMHSMQHRSEAAQLLTFYGASPGDLDYIFY